MQEVACLLTGGSNWDAIYKTLYESLTRFRKLLENGLKMNKDDLPYFRCVLGVSGRFKRFSSCTFQWSKLKNRLKHPERLRTQGK